ncbi:uncharacterized protein LOC117124087 [Anneissia japonica]|uniref:uncharacterized protein LOC117124087 n=1 Tax=Anneissia japonica TaxID=1529436 RepID=UPI0014257175|nr:uncharacterized protein LOC117124087 [Anneissia japonica]
MDPPKIIEETGKNSGTTFSCEWSTIHPDDEPIVVRWFLDGRELITKDNDFIIRKEKRKTRLVIPNITEVNFGNYTCSITVSTNRGDMTEMSQNSIELKMNVNSTKTKNNVRILLPVAVSAVVITICVISFAVFQLDRKYASSKKNKLPFELFVEKEFFCNEGESADMVLRYEPKNAKTASISWFKINKEQDRTDHILTFNTDFKQRRKSPTR